MTRYAINERTINEAVNGGGLLVVAQWEAKEGEADKVMLQVEAELYQGPYDAKEVIFLLQLFEMVEKAVDRCRERPLGGTSKAQ